VACQVNVTFEELRVEPGGGLSIVAADPGDGVGVAVGVGAAVGVGDGVGVDVGATEGVGLGVAEEVGTR
jgi:hypothetical protein